MLVEGIRNMSGRPFDSAQTTRSGVGMIRQLMPVVAPVVNSGEKDAARND